VSALDHRFGGWSVRDRWLFTGCVVVALAVAILIVLF
jgi:hypothetical protein